MIKDSIVYFDHQNEKMEKIFAECALPEVELGFYQPSTGKKGELKDAEVLWLHQGYITKEVIEQMPKVKLIQEMGIGVDRIDLEFARSRGIYVCNYKGGASDSVAEFDIGLMIALLRRIVQLSPLLMEKGEWNCWTYRHDSYTLAGKTIGVIGGAGDIGSAVLKKHSSFGMREIYYDIVRLSPEREAAYGAEYVELDTLLRESDIVLLVVPLLPSTYHMLGAEEFKKMKKTAILVNDARGKCVDQKALAEALRTGEIWGAALDVFESEPPTPDDPLFHTGSNVIATPHLGSSTVELVQNQVRFCVGNALKVLNGERPDNIVNGL